MTSGQSFEGQVIAITGGASGIGLATSQLLVSRGASVSICDIDDSALSHVESLFKDQASRIQLTRVDVSKRAEVDEWISATVSRFGKLTGAVNCAGVIGKHHGLRAITELEDDQWDLIMDINLKGMMNSMRAELRNIGPGGSVVCVTSIQSTLGFAKHAAYNASKHGVLGLVRCAALEMGPKNIRVNGVAPGLIDTPLVAKRDHFMGFNSIENVREAALQRAGKPEEVANVIVFLLSNEASYVNGANYAVDGARETAI
ncbi:uncharacterized protein PV09_01397 [Verruconis gallopava]|uniref:Uncharacterized protein n=1 Tax=Verruconis gallopava TaxID=253628 RepID=A0A0D1Z6E4_9PEZI|nr:uncharacterized protein PV09_01397 [Verruconis gallopava]KIW08502.1 hypothetical protein PV09_01397 [Verruconis gallopava]